MNITLSFDSSVTTSSNAANIEHAANLAVTNLEAAFTNPMSFTIDIGYGELAGQGTMDAGSVGESSTQVAGGNISVDAAVVQAALFAHDSAAGDSGFASTLVNSLSGNMQVTPLEAAELGLSDLSGAAGAVGISTDYSYNWDGTGGSGYDAVGVFMHEISEVMGRISYGGSLGMPADFARYASSGTYETGHGGYLSVNGGTTNLGAFGSSGDYADFSSDSGPFGAAETQDSTLSSADLAFMNALGWDSSGNGPAVTVDQINAVYNTLEAPVTSGATAVQQTSWFDNMTQGLDGNAGNLNSVVTGGWVQTNGVPVLDAFHLVTGGDNGGYYSAASTYDAQLGTINAGSLNFDGLCSADVGSQVFANIYNGGTLVDPNASLSGSILVEYYDNAFGHAPSGDTYNAWMAGGYTNATAFETIIESSTYTSYNNSADNAQLTSYADAAAGFPGSQTAGEVHIVGAVSGAELATLIAHHAG